LGEEDPKWRYFDVVGRIGVDFEPNVLKILHLNAILLKCVRQRQPKLLNAAIFLEKGKKCPSYIVATLLKVARRDEEPVVWVVWVIHRLGRRSSPPHMHHRGGHTHDE
jgi:hypothetical protein